MAGRARGGARRASGPALTGRRRARRCYQRPRSTGCAASCAAAEEAYREASRSGASRSRASRCCGSRRARPRRRRRRSAGALGRGGAARARAAAAGVAEICSPRGDVDGRGGAADELAAIAARAERHARGDRRQVARRGRRSPRASAGAALALRARRAGLAGARRAVRGRAGAACWSAWRAARSATRTRPRWSSRPRAARFEALGAAPDVAAWMRCSPGPRPRAHGLTARELEVLRLVAAGRTNREIAASSSSASTRSPATSEHLHASSASPRGRPPRRSPSSTSWSDAPAWSILTTPALARSWCVPPMRRGPVAA